MRIPLEVEAVDILHPTIVIRKSGAYQVATVTLPAETVRRHNFQHGDIIDVVVLKAACPKPVLSEHESQRHP